MRQRRGGERQYRHRADYLHASVPMPGGDGEAGLNDAFPQSHKTPMEETVDLLLRGKWIIVACSIIVTAGAWFYTDSLQAEYEASNMVLVQPRETSGISDALALAEGGAFARNDRSLSNELTVLRNSISIARSVADRLLEEQLIPGTDITLPMLYDDEGFARSADEIALHLVQDAVRFTPEGRDVDVIRVTATSTNPDEAALLANLYAEAYIQATQHASRARMMASRNFLERQEETRQEELGLIEERVKGYMSREGAVALDSEGELLVEQIAQLEDVRDQARIELQMQEASFHSLEEELARIQPQLAQRLASGVEGDIQMAQQKMAELEVSRQQIYLRNPGLRDNPTGDERLAQINEQITTLRRNIDTLSKQYVEEVMAVGGIDLTVAGGGLAQVADLKRKVVDARIAISGLKAKISVMDQRLEEHDAKLRGLPEQTIQLAQMQRARQSAERMYLNIVEKLQEVRIAEESEIGYASVVREARVPALPVRPDKRRNMTLALLFSLALGVGLATVRKRLDRKIYSPDEIRDRDHAVIGVIPKMDRLIKNDFGGAEKVEMDGHTLDTRLVTLLNPVSSIAEAYRQLRTNVQFSQPDSTVQTLLVTSASPGEGKSVTAANLAVAMAQAGRRTLLIDADLRRPRVHTEFGLDREPGLSQLLFESEEPDLDGLATGVDNFFVLPAGRSIPNPAELLDSKRMRSLVAWLRSQFDIIVFDSPPVLLATDSVVLSTQCDATIVVGTAAQTTHPELEHCLETLDGVGAKIIGTVLNQFAPRGTDRYGSRYAYYGKYYGKNGYAYGYSEMSAGRFGRFIKRSKSRRVHVHQ